MNVGQRALLVITRSGLSAVRLHDLHVRADRGDKAAHLEIQSLIAANPELRFVFNSFYSAADRVNTAQARVKKLKSKSAAAADPRNGSWQRLNSSVGKAPGSVLKGGLPGLGKRS